MSRLHSTERKLDRDSKLAEACCVTVNDYISRGYARKLLTFQPADRGATIAKRL